MDSTLQQRTQGTSTMSRLARGIADWLVGVSLNRQIYVYNTYTCEQVPGSPLKGHATLNNAVTCCRAAALPRCSAAVVADWFCFADHIAVLESGRLVDRVNRV